MTGSSTSLLIKPLPGFTHLCRRVIRRDMLRQGFRYHITISLSDGWKDRWQASPAAWQAAWQRELQIRNVMTLSGTTVLRTNWVNSSSSVAWITHDDQHRVPYGLIGAQRLSVGRHPFQASVSL